MVYFIGAGPGDPKLLTIKAAEALEKAHMVIYAGSLVNKEILKYCGDNVIIHDSASMDLDKIINLMEEGTKDKKIVARVHTGDPSIYGAIKEQMLRLDEKGISYEVIPGVSSFTAAASRLNAEFTLPGISQTVIITRVEGRTGRSEGGRLEELAKHRASMAIFLSIQEIDNVIKSLLEGYDEDTPVAVVYKATWDDESILKGTLVDIGSKVRKAGITRHAMILVGRFLKDEGELSKLYASSFSHMFREAKQ